MGVSDRELPRLASMGALYFVLMFGWGMGMAGRDAFFIKEVGPSKLPIMYILNSVLILLISMGYSRVVDRIGRSRFLVAQLVFFSGMLLFFWLLIPYEFVWLPFVLFSFAEVIWLVALDMHFWTYATDIFDPREGKRNFPVIGGMGLIGGILGGGTTRIVVGVIGTENIFLFWALTLLAAVPLTRLVRHTVASAWQTVDATFDDEAPVGLFAGIGQIWKLPIIRTLTYISVPMWMVTYFIEYQFFIAIDEVFVEKDELTGFLGIFYALVALLGFVLQVSVTGRLLNRFGVGYTVLVNPVVTTIGTAFLVLRNVATPIPIQNLFHFRPLSAIFTKLSDDAVYDSVGESATRLLYNAVPNELRGQARAFISGTVEPLCIILAGVSLLVLEHSQTSFVVISVVTFALSLSWLVKARDIKFDYLHALINNLGSTDPDLRGSAVSALSRLKDSHATEILVESVISSDKDVAMFALDLLEENEHPGLGRQLCDILPDAGHTIQLKIMAIVGDLRETQALGPLRKLLASDSSAIRAAAIRAIRKIGDDDFTTDMRPYIGDSNAIEVRTETVISCIGGAPRSSEESLYNEAYAMLLDMARDRDPEARASAAYIIGEVYTADLFDVLLTLARSEEETVLQQVITACGSTGDARVVPTLIAFLDDNRFQHAAMDAIAALGVTAMDPLHESLKAEDISHDICINVIRCLGRLESVSSIAELIAYLERTRVPLDLELVAISTITLIMFPKTSFLDTQARLRLQRHVSYELMRKLTAFFLERVAELRRDLMAVHRLRAIPRQRDLYLLIDGLQRLSAKRQHIILKYLEILSDPKVIRTAASNLDSSDRRKRAEALEVLEGSCPEAKNFVVLLEEEAAERGKTIDEENPEKILSELLDIHDDDWIRACVVYSIGELQVEALMPKLQTLKTAHKSSQVCSDSHLALVLSAGRAPLRRDHLVKHNIYMALHKFGVDISGVFDRKEVGKLAINMQRMLFLRSVPLFSDVDGSDLHYISEITKQVEISSGQTIFEVNDEGDALYLIESGSVRVVTGGAKAVTLAILQERDCFGEMAILDSQPRSASVVVQKDAKLLMITRADFQGLLLARPKIAFSLFSTLSQRLRATLSKLTSAQKSQIYRETAVLDRRSKSTYRRFAPDDLPTQ